MLSKIKYNDSKLNANLHNGAIFKYFQFQLLLHHPHQLHQTGNQENGQKSKFQSFMYLSSVTCWDGVLDKAAATWFNTAFLTPRCAICSSTCISFNVRFHGEIWWKSPSAEQLSLGSYCGGGVVVGVVGGGVDKPSACVRKSPSLVWAERIPQ